MVCDHFGIDASTPTRWKVLKSMEDGQPIISMHVEGHYLPFVSSMMKVSACLVSWGHTTG